MAGRGLEPPYPRWRGVLRNHPNALLRTRFGRGRRDLRPATGGYSLAPAGSRGAPCWAGPAGKRCAFWICRGRDAYLPLLLVGLAFVLRVHRLAYQSLWRDEVDALRFATRDLTALFATFGKPGENGPLFFLALRPWVQAAGESEFALRFPAAAAGTLAVAAIYAVVCRLAGRGAACVTALLAATAPYLVWYGQEAKMYALLTVVVPLALWLTLLLAESGGWWRWALLYLTTSLAFYLHVLAALAVLVQVVWLLILPAPGGRGKRLAAIGVYLVALVLPYLPNLGWQARLWLSPTFLTGHPFVSLPDIALALSSAFVNGVLPAARGRWLLALFPAALALTAAVGGRWALGAARTAHWARALLLLLSWLLLPVLALYGVSLGMPIFADRYLIWVMPAYLALVGMGVVALAAVWRPAGLAILGILTALNVAGVAAQAGQPIKSDFRAAASYVLARYQAGDVLLFLIPYGRHVFTYYAQRPSYRSVEDLRPANGEPVAAGLGLEVSLVPLAGVEDGDGNPSTTLRLPYLDGPYTNRGMEAEALDREMERATEKARAVWLVASEVPLWDSGRLTENWLMQHGVVTAAGQFARVAVARFELSHGAKAPQGTR